MTDSEPVQIAASDLLLYRQIHPHHVRSSGETIAMVFLPDVTSVAFKPEGERDLSTRNGEKVSARQAHEQHVAQRRESAGTWGFTVKEASELDMTVWDDGGCADLPDCHVTVRYPDAAGRRAKERLAKTLKTVAERRGDRGWLYLA